MAEGWVKVFYASALWLHKRAEILERDNNECQKCKSQGKFHQAECVHHVQHLRVRPELGLIESNLISLCHLCHQREHPEKLHSNDSKKYKNIEKW